nr:MAG TPA: hypothetical protein [Caudoviricetes sp.]
MVYGLDNHHLSLLHLKQLQKTGLIIELLTL